MDLDIFKSSVAKSIFYGNLSDGQNSGLDAIIAAFNVSGLQKSAMSSQFMAYGLATAYWETGRRMQPVRETFADSDAQAIANLNAAFAKGQMRYVKTPYWRDGWFGRGLVQLTFEANYNGPIRRAVLGVWPSCDIHANPDLVLRLDISAFILWDGMQTGAFTGKSLQDFVSAGKFDAFNARKIINPGDASSFGRIQAIYNSFLKAITLSNASGVMS